MAIPGFQDFMLPLMEYANDGSTHTLRETYAALAEKMELTEDDMSEMLPSGKQLTYQNRVGWARTFLVKAGLLESTGRGQFQITDSGRHVLSLGPEQIDNAYLKQFPQWVEWREQSMSGKRAPTTPSGGVSGGDMDDEEQRTPMEQIELGYSALRSSLAKELQELVLEADPFFFEQIVVDLLIAMGYGGSRSGAGKAFGKSNDGGIDGIIDEDRLGLERIYIQAKRWNGSTPVGRPEIQKFAGALQGVRARKGVFLTTATFTREAQNYADSIDTRIVLIDGDRLADLMIRHNVGVSVVQQYEIKRIDTDFFAGDYA